MSYQQAVFRAMRIMSGLLANPGDPEIRGAAKDFIREFEKELER